MTGEEQINLLVVDDSDECARLKNELTTNMDICVEDPMATPSERSCERQARAQSLRKITVKKGSLKMVTTPSCCLPVCLSSQT